MFNDETRNITIYAAWLGMESMNPEVHIFQDLEALSQSAAGLFVEQAQKSIGKRGRFLTALNGGGTPKRLFQLLATDERLNMDWSRTHVFWGDERCVPPDDPESSYGMAQDILLSHVEIPDENVHRVQGERTPDEAAKDYAAVLKRFASPPLEWPSFDLVLLGMGEDGHTASLFPGSPLDFPGATAAVTAHYQDRPASRVTLTTQVINSARMVIFMAAGENKSETLSIVLGDKKQLELYPAQRIQPEHGRLIWLVDEAAAGKLPDKYAS